MAEPKAKKQRLQLIRADLPGSFRSLAARRRSVLIENIIDKNAAIEPPRSPDPQTRMKPSWPSGRTTADDTQVGHIMINLAEPSAEMASARREGTPVVAHHARDMDHGSPAAGDGHHAPR